MECFFAWHKKTAEEHLIFPPVQFVQFILSVAWAIRRIRGCVAAFFSDRITRSPTHFRNALLACVDPIGERNHHVEVVVFHDTPTTSAYLYLFRSRLAFVQFSLIKHLYNSSFNARRRYLEYCRYFFDGHPHRSVRRQRNRNAGRFYDDLSSFNYFSFFRVLCFHCYFLDFV